MSLNQSRSDKNDSQFRKPGGGRSAGSSGVQHRTFSGGRGRGGAPSNTAPNLSTNRSFKKTNNVQVGQSRGASGPSVPGNPLDSNAPTGARSVQNGSLVQSTLHGSNTPVQAAIIKSADASAQRSSHPLPKAPSSQTTSMASDPAQPSTPAKGDGVKRISLQFGSISPSFMNGIQVPPRTSSAPPNLDEQKHDQGRHNSSTSRAVLPSIPLPSAPKQEVPKKDTAPSQQRVMQETHIDLKTKGDVPLATASPPTQPQKPTLPMAGISMPLPFHQSVTMQYSVPSQQMQPQGVSSSSLQMPMQMPLHMANASQVPQQLFVPGLQHHLMQTQGFMHQGQNFTFSSQMGTQLPHQIGTLGMNMPHFNQQQTGKFGANRKAVKITHPDTHEELKLDSKDDASSRSKLHLNGPPQSQALPNFTPTRPIGYPNSYTGGPPLFPVPSSLPSTSVQSTVGSQLPRTNYSVSQAPSTVLSLYQSASNMISVQKGAQVQGKPDSSILGSTNDIQDKVTPLQLTSTRVTVEAVGSSDSENTADSNIVKVAEPGLSFTLDTGVVMKDSELMMDISSASAGSLAQGTSLVSSVGSPRKSYTHVDAIKSTSSGNNLKQQGKKEDSQSSPQGSGDASIDVVSELAGDKTSLILEAVQSPVIPVAAANDISAVGSSNETSSHSSESCRSETVVKEAGEDHCAKQSELDLQEKFTGQSGVTKEKELPERLQSFDTLKIMDSVKRIDQGNEYKHGDRGGLLIDVAQRVSECVSSHAGDDKIATQHSSSGNASSSGKNSCGISDSSSLLGIKSVVNFKNYDASKSSMPDNEAGSSHSDNTEVNTEQTDAVQNLRPSSLAGTESGQYKGLLESNKTKNKKGGKKWKELLQKADALGATSDLYMAYKGPEEKKDIAASEITAESNSKEVPVDVKQEASMKNEDDQSKPELDDWEDAADISMPKLQSSVGRDDGSTLHNEEGLTAKKYSRDFLLTFSDQCTTLPVGFDIPPGIADALICGAFRGDHEFSNVGKIIDRPTGAGRLDRRGSSTMDSDRRSKLSGPYPSGRDPGIDPAHGNNAMGFRTGPGPNYGVLRNPRVQGPGQAAGGILSGPMHSLGFQGVQRNYSDADRWQRATNYNKGLMPVPHTPLQVMHKAEKKYEVGKISDEEQAKQRKLKAILNKLTPQNFEKLFEQVKEVNIDNAVTLNGVISQIFDKALMEPTFCEMYAEFCSHLASELPVLRVNDEQITFKRLLVNKCQDEFERGEREEKEANEDDGDGEVKQSEAEREEKRLKARRRMLGNIRLIGELYKKRMLTERIMHEACIKKLLGEHEKPDEEDIESLCKLMSTIGEMIDHPKAKEHMDSYFEIMGQLSNNMKLSSRVRFMLRDVIDLRKSKWEQRRKVEGPKKIEDVHRDAAQERHGQSTRLSHGPSMNSAMRRGQPVEFSPRGPMLSSPVVQGGSFRSMSSQVRGYGVNNTRMDDRNVFDNRTLSVSLPQRLGTDESITLGPQGGLAREMAFRGQPSMSSSPLLDTSSYGDPRRISAGLNGYKTASNRGVYSSREDNFGRLNSERFGGPGSIDQSNNQDHSSNYANRDLRYSERNEDRLRPTTPPVARSGGPPAQNLTLEKVRSEEHLRDLSVAAIKEYYSARDEKEVALCVKDLNPRFHPKVVATWVADSFERKDMERDLLGDLLVNLAKPREGLFSASQLIEGFQSVLSNFEDIVTDAPRAPEFLGRIFGKIVAENVLPLTEVGQLVHEGGEEPGSLLTAGLAADVLGSVLEMIKSDKGESVLNQIRAASNLRLEDFRPPDPLRSRKIEMFMQG